MKVCSFTKFKGKKLRGNLVILFFFSRGGGEQAFVEMIKHLIDFDGNKLSRLSGWVCFFSIKMNFQNNTTGCVSITSDEITLNEQYRSKFR